MTVAFQDSFQLKTVEEMAQEQAERKEPLGKSRAEPAIRKESPEWSEYRPDAGTAGAPIRSSLWPVVRKGATMAIYVVLSGVPCCRYVVARVLRGLFWCLKYTVILPLATMALMALFVLWKDNTTPGKLLVQEINFVRQTATAGQFPVSECRFSSSDLPGAEERNLPLPQCWSQKNAAWRLTGHQ